MIEKILCAVRSVFRRPERMFGEEVTVRETVIADAEPAACGGTELSGTADGGMSAKADGYRCDMQPTAVQKFYSRMPSVRRIRVGCFADAYRFWLRLCGRHSFSCKCSGGHVHYTAVMEDKTTVCLTDKTGLCGTVAVLSIRAPASGEHVKEIKFIVKDKKQTENEDNKVRLCRKRGFLFEGMYVTQRLPGER